ncbi:DUF3558 family protein [Nocardia panacis]|uniref:DUF3558 family protein n=1 Tax=Nocardia panacis TaxID=2340916 RepID=UPI001315A1C6|nr:DUF3558 family protein [Nocardia panacis]
MTARRMRLLGVGAVAAAGLVAGCSSADGPGAAAPIVDPFADCSVLTPDQITEALGASSLTPQHHPPVCVWHVARGEAQSDVTFTAVRQQSLQQAWQRAEQDGYRLEHLTIVQDIFGTRTTATGFYLRSPTDPGDCAVSAASNGTTVTWRVRNHSHSAAPDPCAAALALIKLTVDLSP